MRTLAICLLLVVLALTTAACVQVSEAPDPADPGSRHDPFLETYEVSPLDVIDAFGSSRGRAP